MSSEAVAEVVATAPQADATEGVMNKISQAAREDVALARKLLKENFDAGVARLTMQFNDIDARLVDIQKAVDSYSVDATKAMRSFLDICQNAIIEANDLVSIRQAEAEVRRLNNEKHQGDAMEEEMRDVLPLAPALPPMKLPSTSEPSEGFPKFLRSAARR